MAIDIQNEKLYLFSELARKRDKSGERMLPGAPAVKTLWDYYKIGRKNRSGVTVFLESHKIPGGLGTTVQAYFRWLEELNG